MRTFSVVARLAFHAAGCAALSLFLVLAGLTRKDYVERSQVDPDFPADLTYLVKARGCPFPWLVTDRSEAVAELRLKDRVLASTLRTDWVLLLVPATLLWIAGLVARTLLRRRAGPRTGETELRSKS